MKKEVELMPIRVPNYILIRMPVRVGDLADMVDNSKFHVKELDSETLSGLCDEFRKNVFSKACRKDPRDAVKGGGR